MHKFENCTYFWGLTKVLYSATQPGYSQQVMIALQGMAIDKVLKKKLSSRGQFLDYEVE